MQKGKKYHYAILNRDLTVKESGNCTFIVQYRDPIYHNGWVEIATEDGDRRIVEENLITLQEVAV